MGRVQPCDPEALRHVCNIAWLSTHCVPSSVGLYRRGVGEPQLSRAPVPFGRPRHRVCSLRDTEPILLPLLILLTPVWNTVEQAGASGFLSSSGVPGTEAY